MVLWDLQRKHMLSADMPTAVRRGSLWANLSSTVGFAVSIPLLTFWDQGYYAWFVLPLVISVSSRLWARLHRTARG